MSEPIEEAYFNWLYSKVARVVNLSPSITYLSLFRTLYKTEFIWLVSGDDNRCQDGLDIRTTFLRASNLKPEESWLHVGCSVLEMLIALSNRAEFETDVPAKDWFWIFLTNLDLAHLNDAERFSEPRVNDILYRFLWRQYSPHGYGGLFPLRQTLNDQRKVELWYQFSEYLVDQENL